MKTVKELREFYEKNNDIEESFENFHLSCGGEIWKPSGAHDNVNFITITSPATTLSLSLNYFDFIKFFQEQMSDYFNKE